MCVLDDKLVKNINFFKYFMHAPNRPFHSYSDMKFVFLDTAKLKRRAVDKPQYLQHVFNYKQKSQFDSVQYFF